jgi:DNA modification methylase
MKNNNPFGGEKEEKMGHSTQKPIECMARPLRNHGKDGDVVYDPFLGSGTTLIAADKLKRRCIGIEINPVYCQVVVNRYEKYCKENGRNPIIRINGSPA